MTGLEKQYPMPRIGQFVRLHDGRDAKVVSVRNANAVLKLMKEDQAIVLATNAQSRFGHLWRDVYYHADVMYSSGAMDVIDTSKVQEIFDSK